MTFDKEMKIPIAALNALKKSVAKAALHVIDVALDTARREAVKFMKRKFSERR